MNQNKLKQKQTGYPGSDPADQAAQEPDLSEGALKPSAFSKDAQELSALSENIQESHTFSENVQEPHIFRENDSERDSTAAQDEADQPNGRGQTILRCPRCGHHHE